MGRTNESLLFQKLTKQQLDQVSQFVFSSDVKDFRLLKGGMFNTTYLISIKNTNMKYVLRVGPVRQELLLPFEQNLAVAEICICELLKKNNIPSNKLVASDFSQNIINREYIIFEYIDGINLSKKFIKSKNKAALYKRTGELTQKIHRVQGDYFGRVSDYFRGIKHCSWHEYILAEVEELYVSCAQKQVLPEKLLNEFSSLYQSGAAYFDTTAVPYLVHGDLWDGNIMVSKDQKNVIAIIDTDRSIFGDPDIDLANPWIINKNFLDGYGTINSNKEREIKLLYYQLLYAIIDCYVFKIEYQNPRYYMKRVETARQLVSKIKAEL